MGAHAQPLAALAAVLPEIGANLENVAYLNSDVFETLCEYFRTRGQSGLINTRHYNYGGARAYHRPGVTGYAAHNIHDHPNHQAMPGMAEVSACINGIFLRTRHNDYKLNAPIAGGTYLQTAEIPLPAVPPSVLALSTPEAQIEEMRQYFIAFATGDAELRDYEPFFRWSLSYLEVWAEVLTDTIGETFNSDRHQINVNNLYAAIAKHTMYSVTGHQDRPENTPHIPFIVRFTANDGRPKWALIRYRICAVDVGDLTAYAPGSVLAYRDQFMLRQATGLTAAQLFNDRRCRFELAASSGYQYTPTLLDELMSKVPGLNGGGTLAEQFNDTGTPYTTKAHGSNTVDLNAAFYNRFYSIFFTASGRANVRRGWNDPALFVAATTRPEVAPVLDPTMSNAERRYSYAIPLELILRTPLEAWNPYGLALQATPAAGGADGKTDAKAYNGWNPNNYNHKVPAGFYAGLTPDGDPADTDAGDIRVKDPGGVVRLCRNSGLYVFLPPIAGITDRIRLRYPIAPCYDEGSYEWGYSQALQEALNMTIGSPVGSPVSFATSGPTVRPGGGASLVFDAPLVASIVARRGGAASFTRNTIGTVFDHEGVLRYCAGGEARFQGARRVENLMQSAHNDFTTWALNQATDSGAVADPFGSNEARRFTPTAGATNTYVRPSISPSIGNGAVNGRRFGFSIYLRAVSGTPSVDIQLRDGPSAVTLGTKTVTLSTSWRRYYVSGVGAGSGSIYLMPYVGTNNTWNEADGAFELYGPQIEETSGSSVDAPGEYVRRGVLAAPYFGANVDGVKYFDTLNGNTVDGNGVVTESVGSAIAESTLAGYLQESIQTNLLLYSNDFSNSVWAKSNATIDSDSVTLPDGRVGTANTMTATAANATLLQSVTSASANRSFSVYIKRKTGSGSVEITTDGGTTWKDVTAAVTSSWNAVETVKLAVTDPQAGIRLGTSGDAIHIAFAQLEAPAQILSLGAAPLIRTSYIPTTSASVTRNADILLYPVPTQAINAQGAFEIAITFLRQDITGTSGGQSDHPFLSWAGQLSPLGGPANTGSLQSSDGTSNITTLTGVWSTYGQRKTIRMRWNGALNQRRTATDGGLLSGTHTFDGAWQAGLSNLGIGCINNAGASQRSNCFKRLLIYGKDRGDSWLQAMG